MSPNRRRPMHVEKPLPYWWWQGASVEELTRRLVANPGARLEVHIDEKQHATFVVVPAESEAKPPLDPPINDSHVCPPQC